HPMDTPIPTPPVLFGLTPHGNSWFHWDQIERCFWPRYYGFNTSVAADPSLGPVAALGGVYLMSWSLGPPRTFLPDDEAVCYVGETSSFKNRMGGFGSSAGLWSKKRDIGHSASWRWPIGRRDHLWAAFFHVPWPLGQKHLASGLR